VSTSIERLETFNPALNVLADRAFDDALEAATAMDRDDRPHGALAGIPTLIKDLEDWRGHPTRKGSLALRAAPPATSNGVVPQRLHDAGAIVVGKSTLPEFAIEGYTANDLTGVTRNPWNLDYSPGGSSGGSAAAVVAGLVGVATATDGGGSIRIPASLSGLVGIKPTNGLIGRWPAHDWIDYSTDGPFATATDDLRLLLDVMVGPVAGDPTAPTRGFLAHMTRLDGRPQRLIAADRTSPLGPLPDGVVVAFHEAVAAFADVMEASITWRAPEGFFTDGDPDLDWFTVTTAEHVASLGRAWVETHMDEFHVSTQEFLSTGLRVTAEEYLEARRRRFLYVRTMDELLGDDGLLLTPAVASDGWLADGRLSSTSEVHGLPPEVYSTAMQNVTGHPAITIPFGVLPTGLPFGLQVTAAHFDDYRLLDVADLVEAAYPWARTAPGYESLASLLEV
jgi:Asp-tRNA(Asn)/Glu-tRNA(Gln) amidotransferase A subunit family amidase